MKLEYDCKCVICEFNDGVGTCLANPCHDECGICTTRKLKYATKDTHVSIVVAEYDRDGNLIKDNVGDSPKSLNDVTNESFEIKSVPPGILGNTD